MAEVDLPPGGARRIVRPLLASQVVGRSLRLWATSLPQLLVVAAMICTPFFAAQWLLLDQSGWRQTLASSLPMIQLVAVTAVGQAFAVRFVFQRLRGEPTDLARSIAVGARRCATVFAIALLLAIPQLAYLSVSLSFLDRLKGLTEARDPDTHALLQSSLEMLLAVFATLFFQLIVVLVYPVAAPAAVVEGSGVIASLRRSAQLTKGRRKTIFGITMLYALIGFIPLAILSVAINLLQPGVAQFLAQSAFELAFASLACVTPVVLYHDLRDTKEGFGVEDLAAVFD